MSPVCRLQRVYAPVWSSKPSGHVFFTQKSTIQSWEGHQTVPNGWGAPLTLLFHMVNLDLHESGAS